MNGRRETQTSGNPREIEINIDRLIIEGLDRRDAAGIGDELKAELSRLITRGGLPPGALRPQMDSRIDIGAVPESATAGSRIAVRTARAIYRQWGGR